MAWVGRQLGEKGKAAVDKRGLRDLTLNVICIPSLSPDTRKLTVW